MDTIYIRNMVCSRCKMAVDAVFKYAGAVVKLVDLGEVVLEKPLDDKQQAQVQSELNKLGFEIIDDKKSQVIEQIKTLLVNQIHHSEDQLKVKLSSFLAYKLNADYSTLSKLFSEIEGTTIEQYHILLKIEKVKELLVYNEMNLNEIADKLGYSSAAHLSNQFKKVTGLSPSHFKELRNNKRTPLENL